MADRDTYDQAYSSGNPGIYVGMQTVATEEPTFANPIDNSTTVAVVGKILVRQQVNTNVGGALYVQSATANQRLMPGAAGVVTVAAVGTGSKARIKTKGVVLAFVQNGSNTSKTINAGDDLCLDGNGNLTSCPSNPYAAAVATAMFTMNGSTNATASVTLQLVDMGGAY